MLPAVEERTANIDPVFCASICLVWDVYQINNDCMEAEIKRWPIGDEEYTSFLSLAFSNNSHKTVYGYILSKTIFYFVFTSVKLIHISSIPKIC